MEIDNIISGVVSRVCPKLHKWEITIQYDDWYETNLQYKIYYLKFNSAKSSKEVIDYWNKTYYKEEDRIGSDRRDGSPLCVEAKPWFPSEPDWIEIKEL